ncbi:MAG: NAD-dependent epimerase/dehydratase family protein, partial [Caulobacterales bacterium]|nr:NAD-dependent epimerase/dehydratase family protein [Caulobacterales bacterium]
FAYARSNLLGHLSVLEFCRHAPHLQRLVYASSSSVYGAKSSADPTVQADVDEPVSLYAATKRADELMSGTYASLYGLRQIGLRLFSVYGPWGRPDMAYWLFTEKMLAGEPIQLFNRGEMKRDFTYIDDVVDGVIRAALQPVELPDARPHRIYDVGGETPEKLTRFIDILEAAAGCEAQKILAPMQPGDVYETCASLEAMKRDFGWSPTTTLEEGLPRFVSWYRSYHGIKAAAE